MLGGITRTKIHSRRGTLQIQAPNARGKGSYSRRGGVTPNPSSRCLGESASCQSQKQKNTLWRGFHKKQVSPLCLFCMCRRPHTECYEQNCLAVHSATRPSA